MVPSGRDSELDSAQHGLNFGVGEQGTHMPPQELKISLISIKALRNLSKA
jgi:hypothetical protein